MKHLFILLLKCLHVRRFPPPSSIAPAPPLRAATEGLRYFLLPDLLSTAIHLSREGSQIFNLSEVLSWLNKGKKKKFLDREEGGGNRRTCKYFNNKINKHKIKEAAPHGRLPHTKHKLKSRPGPLSSSTVITRPFIPSEAPPWDSRPVSGAGVVHYHLLHRPRSVPTALGPAPLITSTIYLVLQIKKMSPPPDLNMHFV